MSVRVAIQMDDPSGFNPASDSTIALGLEAQKRGHKLHYFLPSALSYADGTIIAQTAYPITFHDSTEHWYDAGNAHTLDLKRDVDVVLVRQDPPFDMSYITATYLLEHVANDTFITNPPAALRNHPEKLSILRFAEHMPATIITRNLEHIELFQKTHSDIVVKPLYGYGGRSVYRFKQGDGNLHTLLEQFFTTSKEPLMVQAFLPEVASQDVRVMVVDGEVHSVLGRIPAEGEMRANLRVGGCAAMAKLNDKQQAICSAIGEFLKEEHILFAGIDLIGDYLTEINITSPTCIPVIHKMYGINPAEAIWGAIEAKIPTQ